MHTDALVRELLVARPLSAAHAQTMLADAMALQAEPAGGELLTGLLRGRRIGLMCASDASEDARLFVCAAGALGARVSLIPPCDDAGPLIAATATLLDQLYDAVECQGIDPVVVSRLAEACTIPVFPGLASSEHPGSALARRLPGDAPLEHKRCRIVQAFLLRCLH